jgi:outer membrane protein OmpA-like peptidoglycan-associated protein
VDGLISDATFVGLPGNEDFFKLRGNLSGFDFKQKQALKLPADPSNQRPKKDPKLFEGAYLDYEALAKLGDLHGKPPSQARILAEPKIEPETTIFSFEISFDPNQDVFPVERYRDEFQRALEVASLFGNTVVAIRGHADSKGVVEAFFDVAVRKGLIRKLPNGDYVTTDDNKPIRINTPADMKTILAVIEKHPGLEFFQPDGSVKFTAAVEYLQGLSTRRSETVRRTMVQYAANNGLLLDEKQFRAKGVGLAETKGLLIDSNRRVEFSIIKVPQKDINPNEFDL